MRLAVRVDHDIRGLEIAVQDASLMCMVHGAGHHGHQLRGHPGPWVRFRECLTEASAVDQLHHEVTDAVVLAHVVDRHNVRMIEIGDRLGLEVKPADIVAVSERSASKHLEGHRAIEAPLHLAINDAHPPIGRLANQLVVAKTRTTGMRRVMVNAVGVCPVPGRREKVCVRSARDPEDPRSPRRSRAMVR